MLACGWAAVSDLLVSDLWWSWLWKWIFRPDDRDFDGTRRAQAKPLNLDQLRLRESIGRFQ